MRNPTTDLETLLTQMRMVSDALRAVGDLASADGSISTVSGAQRVMSAVCIEDFSGLMDALADILERRIEQAEALVLALPEQQAA